MGVSPPGIFTRVGLKLPLRSSSAMAWQHFLDAFRQAEMPADVDVVSREPEGSDHIPKAQKTNFRIRHFLFGFIGEMERQSCAAAESDDVDGSIPGTKVFL